MVLSSSLLCHVRKLQGSFHAMASSSSPPSAGFGNSTEDYEAPFGKAEGSLANNLRVGHHVAIQASTAVGCAQL